MVPVSPGCHTNVLVLLLAQGVSALPLRLTLVDRVLPLPVDVTIKKAACPFNHISEEL